MFINTHTDAYKRVTGAGFEILAVGEAFDVCNARAIAFARVKCVCGRVETVCPGEISNSMSPEFKEKYMDNGAFDAALYIEDAGALSADHLRADGYTDEEIAVIRRHYN